jgi:methyl-accepting chemotaxis protein
MVAKIDPFGAGMAAVCTNGGMVAASFEEGDIGKRMADTAGAIFGEENTRGFTNAVTSGTAWNFSTPASASMDRMQWFTTPFVIGEADANPWSLLLAVPFSYVMRPVYTVLRVSLIITAGIIILMALGAFFVSRTISKPIVKTMLALKDISEGEGDLTKTVDEKEKNEIGELGHYFNLTLEKIRNLILAIRGQSDTLSNIGMTLASNMNQTAAAVNQITANIQSIKGRVINQSASVTETTATMEQVTFNIERLNSVVNKQTEAVTESSAAIEEMIANIQSVAGTLEKNAASVSELNEASGVGRQGLSDVSTDIQEIAKESEGLLEINSVMQNIASQTNLLSMNAAIEAAHAGEAGKGFAVVADEIRKLAESSSEQSKTIGQVLKKIKESIDNITKSTGDVLRKFDAIEENINIVSEQTMNIRSAMDEQSSGGKQILEAIGNLNGLTQDVKDGSSEMLTGSQQVITESKNLARVTEELENGMNEMATGADQINTAVTRVNKISVQNKDAIDTLVGEVSKFKTEGNESVDTGIDIFADKKNGKKAAPTVKADKKKTASTNAKAAS